MKNYDVFMDNSHMKTIENPLGMLLALHISMENLKIFQREQLPLHWNGKIC